MRHPFTALRNTVGVSALCLLLSAGLCAEAREDPTNRSATAAFSTNGHTVYHLRTAQRDSQGSRAVISAAYDGTVLAHTPEGSLLWQRTVNGHFPFDLAIADIDNDGRDEIFVATAGGTVDALGPDGRHLWSYTTEGGCTTWCSAT
jgi:outer membrane protein assembly factor BamB